ncbi:MAG: hypothetical protein KGJ79_00905 [Alphaproteobacteria bacterium]|nr:hypothetical protein [Alphaproteobacteria bacterium]MDE2109672.1 hypothetical protein [Alphaproteobacteria bacterium]
MHLPENPREVAQGSTVKIVWLATNAPDNATISIWARKTVTNHLLGPMVSGLPHSGSFEWTIPPYQPSHAPCARDVTGGCVGGMNPGTTYSIVVRLYAAPSKDSSSRFLPQRLLASAETAKFLMGPQSGAAGAHP